MHDAGNTNKSRSPASDSALAALLVITTIVSVIGYLNTSAAKPIARPAHQMSAAVISHYLPALEFADSKKAPTNTIAAHYQLDTVSSQATLDANAADLSSSHHKTNDHCGETPSP